MPWDPDCYHQFKQERSAPFDDLLALVEARPGLRAIDLGCGTGELTNKLAAHLPGSQVVGIDSSPEMLQRSRPFERAGLSFKHGRIEELDGQWDLIFSNAALQWVDDHPALFAQLVSRLQPGGQIAVQMPSNHRHLSHNLILETASEEPLRNMLSGWVRRSPVLETEAYAELLYQQGCSHVVVFEKVYPHMLADADALADWTSGTALVPYFERLDEVGRELFLQHYRAKLRLAWPATPVFYPFRRILFSARRPA